MFRILVSLLMILMAEQSLAQREATLPLVGQDVVSDSCYAVLKRTVSHMTGYQFGRHPLIWAKEQVEKNLQKADTVFNDSLRLSTVYYYNRQGNIIQTIVTSTNPEVKLGRTKIYDDQNNLVFWENIYQGNTIMRIRRGYNSFNTLLFECRYWSEVGRARLRIFSENKNAVDYNKPVCNCDY